MTTFLLILAGLLAFNFILLKFSCNKLPKKTSKQKPFEQKPLEQKPYNLKKASATNATKFQENPLAPTGS